MHVNSLKCGNIRNVHPCTDIYNKIWNKECRLKAGNSVIIQSKHFFSSRLLFKIELIYLYFPPSFHQTVVSVLKPFRCYNNIINMSCGC